MSKKPDTEKIILKTSFQCRNIKKDFHKPTDYSAIEEQKHLELGPNNEVVIVDDRPIDWQEFQNQNVDKVGLANVLELARRRGESLTKFMFKDEEALDTSALNPMDPTSVKEVIASQDASVKKLEGIAAQLGVSVDTLVKAFMDGTFNDLVAAKVKTDEVKEGDDNA